MRLAESANNPFSGPYEIAQIDLIRNNEFLYTQRAMVKDLDFEFQNKTPPSGEIYYYRRVMQLDANLAWSSPIWIKR